MPAPTFLRAAATLSMPRSRARSSRAWSIRTTRASAASPCSTCSRPARRHQAQHPRRPGGRRVADEARPVGRRVPRAGAGRLGIPPSRSRQRVGLCIDLRPGHATRPRHHARAVGNDPTRRRRAAGGDRRGRISGHNRVAAYWHPVAVPGHARPVEAKANAEFSRLYLASDGRPYRTGDVIRNPDYAATLRHLAAAGAGRLLYRLARRAHRGRPRGGRIVRDGR